MAIKLLTLVKNATFSGLETPKNYGEIVNNLLRVSIWGSVGSGTVALVSFLFSRSIVQEGSWKVFAPSILQASLASCGTCTLVASFISYIFWQLLSAEDMSNGLASFKKLNDQVSFLECRLGLPSSIAALVACLGRSCLNPNQVIKSLAKRSVTPLTWIALSTTAIAIFHKYQENQIGDPND